MQIAIFQGACTGEEAENKREFTKISWAIRMLREAANEKKSANLDHLKQLDCKKYCELREQCVHAYELHLEGLTALHRAKILINEGQHEDERALAYLDEAESRLLKARTLSLKCHTRQTELSHSQRR